MDSLIKSILNNYVPVLISLSLVLSIIVIAVAGSLRSSGKKDDIAKSNQIIKTTLIAFVMLFLSGSLVFAMHEAYMSNFYSGVSDSLSQKLPSSDDINNTNLMASQINDVQSNIQDPKCVLIVVDTIDCVKKTINDIIGIIIEKIVRGFGSVIQKVVETFNFNFLFNLPTDMFVSDSNTVADKLAQIASFENLLKFSEILGLAWVYFLVVTHYFKAIIFSLDDDNEDKSLTKDLGKLVLGFAGVFFAKYIAEAVVITAQAFASFLFSNQLANGLTIGLKTLISDTLWNNFSGFGLALIGLAIFVLVYIILFGFIVFRNAKRYFTLLLMILLSPIFTPMLFFEETKTYGIIFWQKFFTTTFSLIFDLLILILTFVFLSSGGLSLGNLILMLVGMAIVADSNNLLTQISNAAEVAGLKSVVRKGASAGAGIYYRLMRLKS